MNRNNVLIFLAGAITGGIVSTITVKKHYKNIAEKEVQSVLDEFYNDICEKELDESATIETDDSGTEPISTKQKTVKDIIKKEGYDPVNAEHPEDGYSAKIYTIDPDTFENDDRYEKMNLVYYYGDDILIDESDEMQDIFLTVGEDSLSKFGEYEVGIVYVRNERLGVDYVVNARQGKYSALLGEIG